MIVMMIAMTPSLNASSRVLPIDRPLTNDRYRNPLTVRSVQKLGTKLQTTGRIQRIRCVFEALMKFATAALLLTLTALTACSGIPRRESDAETLARIQSYAGDSVSDFRTYSSFNSWTPIDDHHVLIQTNINEAYLLTTFEPCMNLPFATHIALTSRFPHVVSKGFDSIR